MKGKLSKDEKRQFNALIYSAQGAENKHDYTLALHYYESALKVVPSHQKLPLKLEQIKDKIAETKKSVDVTTVNDPSGFLYNAETGRYYLNNGFSIPYDIFSMLLPHQRVAIKWLWEHHNDTKIHGCILGDDMGLGKTVEILAFILGVSCLKDIRVQAKTFLLVVPAMVAQQWETEAKKWSPGITMFNVHDMAPADRRAAARAVGTEGGILLTTYNMVQNDESSVSCVTWDYIILDEAHVIKSKTAKVTQTLKSFKAKHKISATGTPMMNNLMELWNLMDFTTDGELLGEAAYFQQKYERVISKANLKNEESPYAKTRLTQLSRVVGPYILRRTKKDVFGEGGPELLDEEKQKKDVDDEDDSKTPKSKDDLQLTVSKFELIVWIKMDKNQREMYLKLLKSINMRDLGTTYMRLVIGMINYLEKSCSNPPAIKDTASNDGTHKFIDEQMIDFAEKEAEFYWPKLLILLEILKMFEKTGDKCLVFSQYQRTLDSICDLLQVKDVPFMRIDGSVDDRTRKERLKRFNTMQSWGVLLMTIRVGACGLNITGASRVVIFDEGWSVIGNQAVDRVYRIGQTKDVVTYRLVSCGTVEEKMYRRQLHKATLAELALEKNMANQRFRHWFTKDELYALFDVSQVKFDFSTTHILFKEYQPQFPQNMPVYPQWLNEHIHTIESLSGVYGVSDHNFIIKTDLPDEINTHVDDEDPDELGKIVFDQTRKTQQRKKKNKVRVEESGIGDDKVIEIEDGGDELIVPPKKKERSKTCYNHIRKADPFLIKKCSCYCTQDEINRYNELQSQYLTMSEDSEKLLCLMEMVCICDESRNLHINIATLAKRLFKL
ncbi:hypothetical protein EIN_370970 [Entamoeba invadens IP1]|uniref:Non-specific serine/threonine protein kinase n=1 Tax=Entamoeba invadens IP1 TaxID=370355 RepID=A0A0A1UBW7_ENTIV|nr:hypothetical protein EIN_370970 [Entamoeba invadens IP1]ELP92695.1 hypothetical protein EIN_370970 [Entamoeba invadens IP1]|eukprot:XP_004259466.1 hypothetical protein EIN_370970 [Entamoeba invadens IP1]